MKVNTRQRVLEMSARLFNDFGIEAVSIGQIGKALEISPGNITYHFKRKADLLSEHIETAEASIVEHIERVPIFSNPERFGAAYMDLMTVTLEYRFLFIGANYIFQNDLVSEARYARMIDTIKSCFLTQIKRLTDAGYMSAIAPPYSAKMLVDCIWWQWLGWLLGSQLKPIRQGGYNKKELADGIIHIFFLNHHYVDAGFFKGLQKALKKLSK